MFANAEIEADANAVALLRRKIDELLQETGGCRSEDPPPYGPVRKYRLVVGWYPKA